MVMYVFSIEQQHGIASFRVLLDGYLPVGSDGIRLTQTSRQLLKRLIQGAEGDDGMSDGGFGMAPLQNALAPKDRIEVARELRCRLKTEEFEVQSIGMV